MASICEVRDLPHDSILAEAGSAAQEVGFVLRGAIGMTRTLPDGRVYLQGLLLPGDFFGQVLNEPPAYKLEVLSDTRVAAFERFAFQAMLKATPALERLMMSAVLDELDAARSTLLMLSGQKATKRLPHFLVALFVRNGGETTGDGRPISLEIPVGRRTLACYLGTRPETLSRAFHSLAEDKVIALVAHRRIEILDLPELRELAGM